ncbi:hypothetical protein ACIRPP_31480 [Streptomyces sp. NPDC101219]|uniref:hypothetical protein n=1 Tax=Streptomyces sp. NPDC101219 TaxID=3366131 RepID=UPI00380A2327
MSITYVARHDVAEELVAHRTGMAAGPAAPRTLLPVRAAALAALACLAHGWQLGITSAYLPGSLLRAPQR